MVIPLRPATEVKPAAYVPSAPGIDYLSSQYTISMAGLGTDYTELGPGWDTHCHVFDRHTYPYAADAPYHPPKRTPIDLLATVPANVGSIIVMSVPEGGDTRQTVAALEALRKAGRQCLGTIVARPEAMETNELQRLHKLGIRSVRFHIVAYHGDVDKLSADIEVAASKLYEAELKWPIDMQLHFDQWSTIATLMERLHGQYGTVFVADHMFCASPSYAETSPHRDQLLGLLELVKRGVLYVKVTGLDRYSVSSGRGFEGFRGLLEMLVRAKQGEGLLYGSDWPHIVMGPGEKTREDEIDMRAHVHFLREICDQMASDAWQKVWYGNAENLYQ